jgi:hypothetical protein
MKKFLSILFFLIAFGLIAFAESPRFTMDLISDKYIDTTDDVTLDGSVVIENINTEQWELIKLRARIDSFEGGITFIPGDAVQLDPGESHDFDFQIVIDEAVCEQEAIVTVMGRLEDYEDIPGAASVGGAAAIGIKLYLAIDSNIICLEDTDRMIFHDVDGDGVYETEDGDEPIIKGNAYLYDENDTLLHTTNLATSNGAYEMPDGGFIGPQDFYITVDTSDFSGAALNTAWYENVFVNRLGTYSSLGSAYSFSDILDYSNIIGAVPMRSRNTDQTGDWDGSSLSIGPDDKDQIISPVRWDELVAGTDFKYADLDYDGRIDPDDKDHVISPLYWDFPN